MEITLRARGNGGVLSVACSAILVFLGMALVVLALEGQLQSAGLMGLVLAPSLIFFKNAGTRIPVSFVLLFLVVAVYDGILMGWSLFGLFWGMDDIAHFMTAFALGPCCAFLLVSSRFFTLPERKLVFGVLSFTSAMTAGALWEVAEYAVGIRGLSYSGTIADLICGAMGAASSAIYVAVKLDQLSSRKELQ